MLKGINNLLSPDLLHALSSMGHDDEIAIVDANYPAASSTSRLIPLPGVSVTDALEAVLSVMPLDQFEEEAIWCMSVVGDPDKHLPIFDDFQSVIERHDGPRSIVRLVREEFYKRAANCFTIVWTGEGRLYGNVILRKGVVSSE